MNEQKALTSFYAYCQPVELYNILSLRQEAQARILPRNLCYTAASARLEDRRRHQQCQSGKQLSVRVRLASKLGTVAGQPASEQTLSLVAALCTGTSASQGLRPLSAAILHATQSVGCRAEASLPLPEGHDLHDLSLVLLSKDDHPDLRAMGKASGSKITAAISGTRAFGMLDRGSTVCWVHLRLDRLATFHAVMDTSPLRIIGSSSPTKDSSTGPGVAETSSHKLQLPAGRGSRVQIYVTTALSEPQPQIGLPNTGNGKNTDQGLGAANGGSKTPSAKSNAGGQLYGKRKADSPLEQGDAAVHFRYFFDDGRQYYTEKTSTNSCPLCTLRCRSMTGLRQHMEASHSLFDYAFSPECPDVLPVVNVSCSEELQAQDGRFSFDNHHEDCNAVNKLYSFFCPRALRQLRLKQYSMPPRKRKRMSIFVTAQRDQLHHPGVPLQDSHQDNEIGEDTHTIGKAARVDKVVPPVQQWRRQSVGTGGRARRARRPSSSRPQRMPPERQRFFRARSHMPMLDEEVVGILQDPRNYPDSDDEEDEEEWKERCRRKLRTQTQLPANEREFMFNWNLFLFKHPITADLQLPDACLLFAQCSAAKLASHSELRRCFICHLMALWDFGVISSSKVDQCLVAVQACQTAQHGSQPVGKASRKIT